MNETAISTIFALSTLVLFASNLQSRPCTPESTCTTPSCLQASEEILKLIDVSVNPCDDFYKFACGKFLKENQLPDDALEISKFSEMRDLVWKNLKVLLEEPLYENEPRTFFLIKKFYNVCMDTNRIEQYGIKTAKLLIEEFGGWPVVEGSNWNENAFDWKNITYKFRKYGFSVNYFLGLRVDIDAKNSSRRIIILDDAHLITNRYNLVQGFNNTVVQALYKFLIDEAVVYGADRSNAAVELKDGLEFLIELGKITGTLISRQNLTGLSTRMSLNELQQKYSYINWIEYINNVIGLSEIEITGNDIVNVADLNFLTNLEQLLQRTTKRAQANYAISLIVTTIGYALTEELRDLDGSLFKQLLGAHTIPPRWKLCLESVAEKLKVGVSALYARRYFNEDSRLKIQKIAYNLHKELIQILKRSDWMDEETKLRALAKADAIKWHIAYPQELLNDKILDDYHKKLTDADEYFQFVLNIQQFDSDNNFKTLRKIVNKNSWSGHSIAHTVDAFYIFGENSIILPAGILQGSLFDMNMPKFMIYGGIGFIVGHELTHGFDNIGRQYNVNGDLENWWTDETARTFLNKTQCIVKLYSSYVAPELNIHLNGRITQNENIADNGGIKLAYDTYQTWVQRNGQEQCLPNLPYTSNQLFWISAGNAWCSKERLELLRSTILLQSHPPHSLRMFGIMSNSEAFAKDFNCPLGSKMNPTKKCEFW